MAGATAPRAADRGGRRAELDRLHAVPGDRAVRAAGQALVSVAKQAFVDGVSTALLTAACARRRRRRGRRPGAGAVPEPGAGPEPRPTCNRQPRLRRRFREPGPRALPAHRSGGLQWSVPRKSQADVENASSFRGERLSRPTGRGRQDRSSFVFTRHPDHSQDVARPPRARGRHTAPGLGTVVRRVAMSLAIACVVPATVFYVCFVVAGVWTAIVGALAWSYGAIGWRAITGRRTSGLLILTAIVMTLRTLIALVTGQHLPVLPPADHQRRRGRDDVPAVAGHRAAVRRPASPATRHPMDHALSVRPPGPAAVPEPHRAVGLGSASARR